MVCPLAQQEQQPAGQCPGEQLGWQTWLQALPALLPGLRHELMLQQQALQQALPPAQPGPDSEWLLVLQAWLQGQLAVQPAGQAEVAVLRCLLTTLVQLLFQVEKLRQQLHCLQTLQAMKANQRYRGGSAQGAGPALPDSASSLMGLLHQWLLALDVDDLHMWLSLEQHAKHRLQGTAVCLPSRTISLRRLSFGTFPQNCCCLAKLKLQHGMMSRKIAQHGAPDAAAGAATVGGALPACRLSRISAAPKRMSTSAAAGRRNASQSMYVSKARSCKASSAAVRASCRGKEMSVNSSQRAHAFKVYRQTTPGTSYCRDGAGGAN